METADREDIPKSPILRGKSAEVASMNFNPRTGNIWLFLIVTTAFSLNSNYVLGQLNQMKLLLTYKLGWVDGSQKQIWLY